MSSCCSGCGLGLLLNSLCVTSTVDLQRHYFKLAFNIPMESTAAVDCRQYQKPRNNNAKIESY